MLHETFESMTLLLVEALLIQMDLDLTDHQVRVRESWTVARVARIVNEDE